jgi:ferredoxin-NADP reductase
MMSVVRYLTDRGWNGAIWLVLGFRSPQDYIFRQELDQLIARNSNLRITITMSQAARDEWTGARGRIDRDLLRSVVNECGICRAHICGPPEMMANVKAYLLELGFSKSQVQTEAFGTVVRNPTTKGVRSTQMAGKVIFQTSNRTVPIPVDQTILEAADEAGVFIDNACRSGTCASCRVKLLAGSANMEVDDALTEQDKAEGYILACQAKVRGEVTIEA